MSSFYVMEKYEPPKNQAPSKVRRFPLYLREGPPPKDPPKEEKPPPPPPPIWSEWQFIKEPLWEGYWRASPQDDGGWHYHLTTDGKTIWEQKVPKPDPPPSEAPESSKSSAKSDATEKPPPKKPKPLTKTVIQTCKTVVSAPEAAPKTEKTSTTTTVTTTEIVPSYTVKKPEPPKPPPPPKKVTGTITLHTKSGKAVTVPLPDPGKPLVIRTLLEK